MPDILSVAPFVGEISLKIYGASSHYAMTQAASVNALYACPSIVNFDATFLAWLVTSGFVNPQPDDVLAKWSDDMVFEHIGGGTPPYLSNLGLTWVGGAGSGWLLSVGIPADPPPGTNTAYWKMLSGTIVSPEGTYTYLSGAIPSPPATVTVTGPF